MSARPGLEAPRSLGNLRVLELATHWAAPHPVRLLSDLGAEVIKLEARPRPDLIRGMVYAENDPGDGLGNRAGYFHEGARNKLGITIDLTKPTGQELCRRLYRLVDVVVENFTPRVLTGFGLDFPVLHRLNPAAVMLSNTAFGRTGPYGDYTGYGATAEAMGGLASLTGYPEGRGTYSGPRKVGFHYGDPVAGVFNAAAILLALRHARRTGRGQHIDMSMAEAVTASVGEIVLDYQFTGREPQRRGNAHPQMAPHGCYPCRGDDCWVVIAVTSDAAWQRLVKVLGAPDWARSEALATAAGRLAAREELDRHLSAWTGGQDRWDVARKLQAAGVAAGPVLTNKEVLLDPHLKERGFFTPVDHPDGGLRPVPGVPYRMSRTPPRVFRPAPSFGEHNNLILGELLGLTAGELERLAAEEVISQAPSPEYKFSPPFPLEDWQRAAVHIRDLDPDHRKLLGLED
ncbi:MAG: CoA transferase [Chloroflexi bacterium]|nr:CoA transferase [Chloroflexota bacterium]